MTEARAQEKSMKVKLIEGTNPDGLYLKAAVCVFEPAEWQRESIIGREYGQSRSLLRQESWTGDDFWILDLSRPGPGGKFTMGNGRSKEKAALDAHHALAKMPVEF